MARTPARNPGKPVARTRPNTPAPAPAAKKSRLPRLPRRKAKVDDGTPSTFTRLKQSYTIARKHDRLILLWPIGTFLLVLGVFIGIGFVLGHPYIVGALGVIVGALAGANMFAFRAQKAMYAEVSDRPGVALEVIRQMRGDWKITEAVQFNRNQDFVHRVVGKPGVILIGEGRPAAVRDLMNSESRRTRRAAPDAALHEIFIGTGAGTTELGKLRTTVTKLPRTLKGPAIKSLDIKLKAVANTSMPLPKGPMPNRVPRGRNR